MRRCVADEKEAEKRRDERIAAMLRPVPVPEQEPAVKVVCPGMVGEGEVSGLSFAERVARWGILRGRVKIRMARRSVGDAR
ncbi:hypothetical protein GCM10020255_028790 [Rhodococcus baikonurensis]